MAKAFPEFRTAFGLYQASKIVGQGGSGTVYSAEDDQGKPVAVKILDPMRATRDKLKRFKNELLFGSRIDHPNVLRVTDHGLHPSPKGEAPFYVMPQYAGSLRGVLPRLETPEYG